VVRNDLSGHKAIPHKQDDQRAHSRTDQTGALTWAIKPGEIADDGSKHCSCHADDGSDNEALGVFGPGISIRAMTPATNPMTTIQRRTPMMAPC